MEKLIWKRITIDDIETPYFINQIGDIISYHKPNKPLFKKARNNKGYLRVNLNINKKEKSFTVHRLVALFFVDGYAKSLVVNHKDGNKRNNYYKNLEWVTQEENETHAKINNLKAKGERIHLSTYTEKEILEVCKLLSMNYNKREISKLTGVSLDTVKHVYNHDTWCHLSNTFIFPKNDNRDGLFSKYNKIIDSELLLGKKPKEICISILNKDDSKLKVFIKLRKRRLKTGTFNDYPDTMKNIWVYLS